MKAVNQAAKDSLEKTLKRVGASPKEIRVFIFLLERGRSIRASELARKININRTTLYGILDTLVEKGLVYMSDERGVATYNALEPHALVGHLTQTKKELEKSIAETERILPLLVSENNDSTRRAPTVKYYEGIKGVQQIYEEILKSRGTQQAYEIIGTNPLYELLDQEYIYSYMNRRAKAGVKMFTLASDGEAARKMQRTDKDTLRETILLPPGHEIDIGLVTYDDKVAITSFAGDYPLGIQITDKKIADSIKTLFQYIKGTLNVS